MDNRLEETLRKDMKSEMESVLVPDDMLNRIVGGHRRRTTVRRRLLAGGGAVGVVALSAALVFGVVLPRTSQGSSGPRVAASAVVRAPTTTLSSPKAIDVVFLSKVTDATSVTQGDILHVKVTTVWKENGRTDVDEIWQTGGLKWQYRAIDKINGGLFSDIVYGYTGYIKKYDATKVIWQCVDEGLKSGQNEYSGYVDTINRMVASGEAVVQGHEQIDGRDAVRIVRKGDVGERDVYLMDAQTGYPIEIRLGEKSGNAIAQFDIYEKLPATEENLKVFDIQASYPDAPVITNESKVRGG